MDALWGQWKRRRAERLSAAVPPDDHEIVVSDSIVVRAAQDVVWALVHAPETSVITDDRVIRAYTVPGTPRGQVGEQQCFVLDCACGQTHVSCSEVVELVWGQKAVTVLVGVQPAVLTTTEAVSVEDGTRVTLSLAMRVPALQVTACRSASEDYARTYLARVKSAIEAGATVPGPVSQ